MSNREKHDRMANAIRALAMDAVEAANSGHPGMPMGMADVATVLFGKVLKFDPTDPQWPDRDRFILSAGHGSMLIYSLLYLTGYEGMTLDDIKHFRQLGSRTPGHPEYGHTVGIETTTGPLGQGLANSVGFALGERMLNAQFGDDLVDHHTYVICGDGCLMEGISEEAIELAGRQKLGKLIVLWDDNHITIDGSTALSVATDQLARFEASGWEATRIDGHDPDAILAAIEHAKTTDKPSLIACRTTIGYGAPNKGGTNAVHGAPLGAAEIAAARAFLNWEYGPFEIPSDVLDAWRLAGLRSRQAHKSWSQRLKDTEVGKRAEFERRIRGELPSKFGETVNGVIAKARADGGAVATRKSSEITLEALTAALPEMVGGSADLTHSNNTKTKATSVYVEPPKYDGRYINYGIREHGMAAAMNGIALHGGFIPYGGTFLVFSDYARGSIRLAALMGVRVVYVFTHDLDRRGRGRADPPAGGAPRRAARHPQPHRVPPLRHGGDGGSLEAGAGAQDRPERAGAHPPEPAAAAHRFQRPLPHRARRLRAGAGLGRGAGLALRLRLGGLARHEGAREPGSAGHSHPRRLGAVLRTVPQPAGGDPSAGHRQGAGEDRHRGCHPPGLVRHRRLRRRLRRHDRLRRLRPGTGSVRAFRHHPGGGGGDGSEPPEALSAEKFRSQPCSWRMHHAPALPPG